MELSISDIKVGKRFRKDLGDIEALKASIEELDLLHPIVITPERKLIAGRRRLEAEKGTA
jgi:ParB family chromosome partitioning protein